MDSEHIAVPPVVLSEAGQRMCQAAAERAHKLIEEGSTSRSLALLALFGSYAESEMSDDEAGTSYNVEPNQELL